MFKVGSEGNGSSLQYSCLESRMDTGASRGGGYSPWGCKEPGMAELLSTQDWKRIVVLLGPQSQCYTIEATDFKKIITSEVIFSLIILK